MSLVAALTLVGVKGVHAEPNPVDLGASASMQCDRAAEPGRVKCSVEIRTTSTRALSWADVTIVELPELASALKGRIGPQDATAREPTVQKWAFALVAKKVGQGEIKARVRAVLCESASDGGPPKAGSARCAPLTIDVKALVQVG